MKSASWFAQLVATVLLGGLLVAACGPAATEAPPAEPTSVPATDAPAWSVTVADQDVAAGTVTVQGAVAASAGWMVIHADRDGSPGPVIGYTPVDAGNNTDIVVEIDTQVATERLYAMLHVDDGQMGTYEFPDGDPPAKDADGSIVVEPFTVMLPAAAPAVSASDQDATEGRVTIDEVVAADPGWLVIHAERQGGPGPVIGYAPVEAGDNHQVEVQIDSTAASETLFAMLHLDSGEPGTYEFPDGDPPVKDPEDDIVMAPFTITMAASESAVTVSDQALVDGTVTVDRVLAVEAGWMVIHADQNGGPGPVIGYAAIHPGLNSNVTVEIDAESATETLYAMLHVDGGQAGTYEFPGGDPPAMNADGVVVKPFALQEEAADMGSSTPAERSVQLVGRTYSPAEMEIPVGTTVVWTNTAALPHTVTADDGSFTSGTLSEGDSFRYTFEEAGTFHYHCQFHGGSGGQGMSGTITVAS